MRLLPDQVVLLDTPAGMEHFGRAVADGFDTALVVAIRPIMRCLSPGNLRGLHNGWESRIGSWWSNRVHKQSEVDKIQEKMEAVTGFSRMIFLSCDPEIIHLEPAVKRLLSRESVFIDEMRILAATVAALEENRAFSSVEKNSKRELSR